ncbi:SGNH/GDSL hydrolase family protein [Bacillus sp. M6-12]|uniref:SGNH/GDSL hydrolase family protein n=1 Tax=Bacillus sp. M6-12 TaxID=2054166 RepID=UPI0015E0F593|nr:SGNH/GDSL hydrolase family protein [Bacillus sp. M6-12]
MKKWVFTFFIVLLASVGLSKEIETEAAERKVTVLFGDSNTAGSNWAANNYYSSAKWANRLLKTRPVINAGVGGNSTGMARQRFKRDVLNRNPKTVIIMFGTNDAQIMNSNRLPRTSKANFNKNIRYFVDTLRARRINVILMTALPVIEGGQGHYYSRNREALYKPYGGAREWHDSYNDITRSIARQKNVPLIDTYRLFIQAAGGNTDQALSASGLYDPTGIHMSMHGANELYQAVQRTLEVKRM